MDEQRLWIMIMVWEMYIDWYNIINLREKKKNKLEKKSGDRKNEAWGVVSCQIVNK